jgi:hypothetical protein
MRYPFSTVPAANASLCNVADGGVIGRSQLFQAVYRSHVPAMQRGISARGELNSERILVSARRGYDLIVQQTQYAGSGAFGVTFLTPDFG